MEPGIKFFQHHLSNPRLKVTENKECLLTRLGSKSNKMKKASRLIYTSKNNM